MTKIWTLIFVSFLLVLGGCASMTDNAITTVIEEAGKITTTFTGDAVQRDLAYMDRGKHRDTQEQKMYDDSGVSMEYQLVSLGGGATAYLPKSISVRAPHTWQQDIETRPPDHRGWATLDKGLNVLSNGLLGYFIGDAFKTVSDNTVTRYNGDYNYQTAEPYIVEPTIVTTP